MRLTDLQVDDVVMLDDGFDCMPAGRATVMCNDEGELCILCQDGWHSLHGQLRDDGTLSGVFWPGEIEAQAAFRQRLEAAGVPAPWSRNPGDLGSVSAADGREAVTSDVNGELADATALEIADIAAAAVNTLAGWPAGGPEVGGGEVAPATPTSLHNQAAQDFVRLVLGPMVKAGATPTELLVMMETAIVGAVLAIVRLGGDEAAVDTLAAGVKARLAEQRLAGIDTAGRA